MLFGRVVTKKSSRSHRRRPACIYLPGCSRGLRDVSLTSDRANFASLDHRYVSSIVSLFVPFRRFARSATASSACWPVPRHRCIHLRNSCRQDDSSNRSSTLRTRSFPARSSQDDTGLPVPQIDLRPVDNQHFGDNLSRALTGCPTFCLRWRRSSPSLYNWAFFQLWPGTKVISSSKMPRSRKRSSKLRWQHPLSNSAKILPRANRTEKQTGFRPRSKKFDSRSQPSASFAMGPPS